MSFSCYYYLDNYINLKLISLGRGGKYIEIFRICMFFFQKWFWCLLALQSGWIWGQAQSGTRAPPRNPSTVEAQAKFFQ